MAVLGQNVGGEGTKKKKKGWGWRPRGWVDSTMDSDAKRLGPCGWIGSAIDPDAKPSKSVNQDQDEIDEITVRSKKTL